MGASKEILTIYDVPMWDSIKARAMALQKCPSCSTMRYPPSPCCPKCLNMDAAWTPLKGQGTILSWVIFHRKYFDDFPPPYNAIAVRLEEGPIMISNLVGDEPEGSWIGRAVEICYTDTGVRVVPQFRLLNSSR